MIPKELTRTVAFMMTRMGRYMEIKPTIIECPYCGNMMVSEQVCFKVKCPQCFAIIVGCHK